MSDVFLNVVPIFVLILLVRPQGLLGQAGTEELGLK